MTSAASQEARVAGLSLGAEVTGPAVSFCPIVGLAGKGCCSWFHMDSTLKTEGTFAPPPKYSWSPSQGQCWLGTEPAVPQLRDLLKTIPGSKGQRNVGFRASRAL